MKQLFSGMKYVLVIVFLATFATAEAQDTTRITLPRAEELFLSKNLDLLAEKYNISIAQAQVIQARLYNNPNIQLSGNIYNPAQRKVFDVSNKTGEYMVTAQQLIILAGKRNKQVQLAETNVLLAQNLFYDLLRTLRYTLRSDFYRAYFLQSSINAYAAQIQSLEELNNSYQTLEQKGSVTLKDAVRIKALLYSLRSEQINLQNDFNDVEAEMQQLLQNNHTWFIPQSDIDVAAAPLVRDLSMQTLVDSAYANRYDIKVAQAALQYDQKNYNLQKALAVPDVTLGASFDKRGSFVDNASFLNLAMDLPFFNRNQGNIKAAKLGIEQSKLQLEKQNQVVENQVQSAYVKALNTDKMLASIDPNFRNQFEQLLKSVTQNFQKRNISILDFTDFYESYKQNILQLNQLQNDRLQALENLNYAIGKNLINY